MRKIIAFSIFFVIIQSANAQNAFYGAIYLNSIDTLLLDKVINMEKIKDSEIINVINYTKAEKIQLNNLDTFLKHPFSQNINTQIDFNLILSAFEKYSQTCKIQLLFDLDITTTPAHVLTSTLPSFKTISSNPQLETNLNDGAAKYYNGTVYKEPQTVRFMNEFKNATTQIKEMQILFPNTSKKLKYEELVKFPDLGNAYKKVFNEDLKNSFNNMLSYIDNQTTTIPDSEMSFLRIKHVAAIKNSDYYFPLKISYETINRISNGYNPVTLINFLDQKFFNTNIYEHKQQTVKDKVIMALHGLNIIQTALRDTTDATNKKVSDLWISFEQLNQFKNNEKKYFIGMIYQRDKKFFNEYFKFNFQQNAKNSKSNDSIAKITTDSAVIYSIEPIVNAVLEQLTNMQEFLNSNNGKGKKENYLKFLDMNFNLIASNAFISPETKSYFSTSNDIVYIFDNIHNANYSNTLFYTFKIISEMQQSKKEFTSDMRIVENYANFMSDIINSTNSDQLEEVLVKYINPKKK